tara:strand:+ start:50 stop:961 length:912 start_codon:yes stop_codon:yes gene_type:complete
MQLTDENYYSREAGALFWSVSKYKRYDKCPAAAKAVDDGRWSEGSKAPLVGGNYAHTAVLEPEKLPQYEADHPEMLTVKETIAELKKIAAKEGIELAKNLKKPELIELLEENGIEVPRSFRSEYSWIPRALDALRRAPAALNMLDHPSMVPEKFLTFELGGYVWKCKIDAMLPPAKAFIDLKFMKDFSETWMEDPDGTRRPYKWFQAWGYDIQMSVYREAIRQETGGELWTPYILGVSKEKFPDMIFGCFLDAERMDAIVAEVRATVPLFDAYARGDQEAPRCGKCDYCRATKIIKVATPIDM